MENFLINKLNAANIPHPDNINHHGEFTRWGHNSKYWLVQCEDGYVFGDWSTGEKFTAFPDNVDLRTPTQQAELNRRIAEQQKQWQIQREHEQNQVSQLATAMYAKMVDAPAEHGYLVEKGIQPYCARYNPETGSLVVPLYDTMGQLWTVQHITPDGEKRFLSGGKKKGCFCPIGEPDKKTVIVCEGFATAATIHQATGFYTVAAMDAGNLLPVAKVIAAQYPSAKLIIAADNDHDKETNTGVESATAAAMEVGAVVSVPEVDLPCMSDFNDVAVHYGMEAVKSQIESAVDLALKPIDYGFKVMTATDFLRQELPQLEFLVHPLIPKNGLSLMYAERGAGKTFMAMAIACAAAGGFDFLNFKVEKPCKVLYIDGEMDSSEMQERLRSLSAGFASEGKHVNMDNLSLFLSGMQENPTMPDIATPQGQQQIESYCKDADLIIVDNIFCMYTAGRENDADSWVQYNAWSRKMRARGKSVLWLHHTGKDKKRGPRGSSAIESILNSSIALEVSPTHTASDGAEISVEYHKSRGVSGDAVRGFAAKLIAVNDANGKQIGLKWVPSTPPKDAEKEHVVALREEGHTIEDIAEITGISKSKVHRMLGTRTNKYAAALSKTGASAKEKPVEPAGSPAASVEPVEIPLEDLDWDKIPF